jgi:hypothetical protein
MLCGLAVGLWAFENVVALVRYRRLSSFHTYLSKIVANILGLFIGVLFLVGFQPWLFYLAATSSIESATESSTAPRRDSSENSLATSPSAMSVSRAGISTQVNAASCPANASTASSGTAAIRTPLSTFGTCRKTLD